MFSKKCALRKNEGSTKGLEKGFGNTSQRMVSKKQHSKYLKIPLLCTQYVGI
jgi:hypothetical protein